ncbi:MAG: phosphatidylserine decarboxylase, partial [Proteobacteria bacterium]|nr:phosphatidylserine decarboxylase [Pseudomonadota bacterium]
MTRIQERAFVWLQYLLPQHGLSRLVRHATRSRVGWFKNLLIGRFLRMYDVDMGDALEEDA